MHDYGNPPLYAQPTHLVPGVLTPPSDFAPQSLGTVASLEGKDSTLKCFTNKISMRSNL